MSFATAQTLAPALCSPGDLPSGAGTIVVGGGTSGPALAAGLVAAGEQVLILEAGPDYGPLAGGRWPADLLDARALPDSHDWGYAGDHQGRDLRYERARVIGGCSSHNGCAAVWGSALDYDGWAAAGCEGWSAAELEPLFERASRTLRVRSYLDEDLTPFQIGCSEAATAIGIPPSADLNDLHEDVGFGAFPVNVDRGVRWNAAFAYLDPIRRRPELQVVGGATVERLLVDRGRVHGVVVITTAGPVTIRADRVAVSCGTYGSPALLLRSGIGPASELEQLGIEVAFDLSGVGRNLQDHPMAVVRFTGTPELERRMAAAEGHVPEEQTIGKLRSSRCHAGFDLHLAPIGGPTPEGGWRWELTVACMTPRSRGTVTLAEAGSEAPPRIDSAFLSDPHGEDRAVLAEGVELARRMARAEPLASLVGDELDPAEAGRGSVLDDSVTHYFHPVGTCAMGTDPDAGAVTDPGGVVHGIGNLIVCDCSIMPEIPRANTNLPAVVVGERIGEHLTARLKGRHLPQSS